MRRSFLVFPAGFFHTADRVDLEGALKSSRSRICTRGVPRILGFREFRVRGCLKSSPLSSKKKI